MPNNNLLLNISLIMPFKIIFNRYMKMYFACVLQEPMLIIGLFVKGGQRCSRCRQVLFIISCKSIEQNKQFLNTGSISSKTSNSTRKYLKNMIVWTVHRKRKKNVNPWSTAVCVELMEDPTTRGDCLMSITVRKNITINFKKLKKEMLKRLTKLASEMYVL